jgi:hypothetical protein
MTVAFGTLAETNSVSATMMFPDITLNFDSGSAGNASVTGFTAGVCSNANIVDGSFNGAFYGPNAASIGGNFHAKFNDNVQYLGIFGGNRTN